MAWILPDILAFAYVPAERHARGVAREDLLDLVIEDEGVDNGRATIESLPWLDLSHLPQGDLATVIACCQNIALDRPYFGANKVGPTAHLVVILLQQFLLLILHLCLIQNY